MISQEPELTVAETEKAARDSVNISRQRINQRRPQRFASDSSLYTRFVSRMYFGSKAAIPVIAILAMIASAVRTIQTASEIYFASGSHPVGVILAAIAFTVATEGTLFVVALAQEAEQSRQRAEQSVRRVTSLKSLWHGIQVRIGLREPQRYDQMTPHDGKVWVMAIAFIFAVAANAYIGFRPLLAEVGAVSLQQFISTLWVAPAGIQLAFLVDLAAIVFPPLMALTAGHQTARLAAEIAEQSQTMNLAYERDLTAWQQAYNDPLATEEGQAVFQSLLDERRKTKGARKSRSNQLDAVEVASSPVPFSTNGTKSYSEMG